MSANKVFGSLASLTIGSLLGAGLIASPTVATAGDHGAAHEAAKHAAHAEGMAGHAAAEVEAHAEKAEAAAGMAQHKAEKTVEDAKAAAHGEAKCSGEHKCSGEKE